MWTDDVESIVLTKIKHSFPERLKRNFPDLNFTTEGANDTEAKFPCVYLQRLPGYETAESLDGKKTAGGIFSFQVTVSDNSSRQTAKRVMDEVINTMAKMHFSVVQLPVPQKVNSIYLEIARFRRTIAEGDIL